MTFLNITQKRAGFTLSEILIGTAAFGLISTALLTTWSALQFSAMNMTSYARRQNDQTRVVDYLKRDIRRASSVAIYNDATLVTGTTTWGNELRVTIPDYYADAREEDNAIGTNTPNTPALTGGDVSYGIAMTVRYYVLNGTVIRDEAGTTRTVADAAGTLTLSFKHETSGDIRTQVVLAQPMRGGSSRFLNRTIVTLCGQRSQLQP